MANAGRHNDTQVLKRMIRDGKLIKVSVDDHPVLKLIKIRFNDIVLSDYVTSYTWNGKKCNSHHAWAKMGDTLIWCNQLRIKYWYFNPLSL